MVIFYALYRFWQFDFNLVTVRGIFRPFYKDHTSYGAMIAFYLPALIALTFKGTGTKQLQWLKFILLARETRE